jgi:hypothetical protein
MLYNVSMCDVLTVSISIGNCGTGITDTDVMYCDEERYEL